VKFISAKYNAKTTRNYLTTFLQLTRALHN
jgi:hypothetical protein